VTRPLFDTSAVAAAIYWSTLLGWFVIEFRQGRHERREATEQDQGSRNVIRTTMVIGIFVAVQLARRVPGAHVHGSRVTVFVVALAIMWAGMALRFSAFRTLGDYFTFTVQTSAQQQVITAGPYRVIRHPSYAGGVLILAGVGLALGNWLSLAANLVIPLIGVINRIEVEERALRATLGDAYASYASQRKRLVPYLW